MRTAEQPRVAPDSRAATRAPAIRHDMRLTFAGGPEYGIARAMATPYPPDHASRSP